MKQLFRALFCIPLPVRLLLYVLMVLSCALSIARVAIGDHTSIIAITVDVVAVITLLSGVPCLVHDTKTIIGSFRFALSNNTAGKVLLDNYKMRAFVFALPGLIFDVVFAFVNAAAGFLAESAWFGSVAAYYILLSVLRTRILFSA